MSLLSKQLSEPAKYDTKRIKLYFNLADENIIKNNIDSAKIYLENLELILKDTDYGKALVAQRYLEISHFKKAYILFNDYTRNFKSNMDITIINDYIKCLIELGKYNKVKTYYQKLVKKNSQIINDYTNNLLAFALFEMKNQKQALAILKKLVIAHPELQEIIDFFPKL